MGTLEYEYRKSFCPPLVKNVVVEATHPGYRYEMFTSFDDLHNHFSKEYGPYWLNTDWAKFWIGQHNDSKRKDRLEEQIVKGFKMDRRNPQATRNSIRALLLEMIHQDLELPSVRKLQRMLVQKGSEASHMTVYRILKEIKKEIENGEKV